MASVSLSKMNHREGEKSGLNLGPTPLYLMVTSNFVIYLFKKKNIYIYIYI